MFTVDENSAKISYCSLNHEDYDIFYDEDPEHKISPEEKLKGLKNFDVDDFTDLNINDPRIKTSNREFMVSLVIDAIPDEYARFKDTKKWFTQALIQYDEYFIRDDKYYIQSIHEMWQFYSPTCDTCNLRFSNTYSLPPDTMCRCVHIQKIGKIQKHVRNRFRYRTFTKWIKSREFAEWFFAPENPGGCKAKNRLLKLFA
jgi:hypothetical protein